MHEHTAWNRFLLSVKMNSGIIYREHVKNPDGLTP